MRARVLCCELKSRIEATKFYWSSSKIYWHKQERKLSCVGGLVWHKWHVIKQLRSQSCEIICVWRFYKNLPCCSSLFLKVELETTINAIRTQKKWLIEASTTQKLHRNYIDTIQQSTDEPVLELLLNLAHADLEIPSTCWKHWISDLQESFKNKIMRNTIILVHLKYS